MSENLEAPKKSTIRALSIISIAFSSIMIIIAIFFILSTILSKLRGGVAPTGTVGDSMAWAIVLVIWSAMPTLGTAIPTVVIANKQLSKLYLFEPVQKGLSHLVIAATAILMVTGVFTVLALILPYIASF